MTEWAKKGQIWTFEKAIYSFSDIPNALNRSKTFKGSFLKNPGGRPPKLSEKDRQNIILKSSKGGFSVEIPHKS